MTDEESIRASMLHAFTLMCRSQAMARIYEANRAICRYVHSTSRGHEAIQLATAFQLQPQDFASPYYRDESMLLGLGFTPYQLMLQLLAKRDDPFTGGREYYAHPNYRGPGKPTIIHQSSATGMQVIPATGIAQGIQYWEQVDAARLQTGADGERPVVLCSMGDASVTEGEVSEAFQFAVLKQLPIIYLVQDNNWGISVRGEEARAMNALEFAQGFKGLRAVEVDGSDFNASLDTMQEAFAWVRTHRRPMLIRATVPLLGHHTSGVRREFYRDQEDLDLHAKDDPFIRLRTALLDQGMDEGELDGIETREAAAIGDDFYRAVKAAEPDPDTVGDHLFIPTDINKETGDRNTGDPRRIVVVDAALYAIRELMEDHPEIVLYGQDVGKRLGGVFRETATLAEQFGEHRVFNTAIQEAYIVGSTIGLNAVGLKPIVEVQFGDYIYPGINQLATEVAKSCYLTMGRFPVSMVLRVPVGAYGGGGPYHSGSVESLLLSIKGIKIVYPSNAADMKGLMKAAVLDGNPVVMLEHKGLYWGKVPGSEDARTAEPARDYILPLGKAAINLAADQDKLEAGSTLLVITYGMGIYWARTAARRFPGLIEIVDLRTLFPLDEELIYARVRAHGKCMLVTEEQQQHSFAESLAGRISQHCFRQLDAPVEVIGAMNLPAVPMNIHLEKAMLPGADRVGDLMARMLNE